MDSSVILTPSRRSTAHRRNKSECMSGSPPEKITHWTPSAAMSTACRCSSAALISVDSLDFQISHITQRQLQRLCG